MAVQELFGRDGTAYEYGIARLITGRISINGRGWRRGSICDYKMNGARRRNHATALAVGVIQDFVAIKYKHKNHMRMGQRYRTTTVSGTLLFARIRQYFPHPHRDRNMWVVPRSPGFKLQIVAVPVSDLFTLLHRAPEHTGQVNLVNMVPVAKAFA